MKFRHPIAYEKIELQMTPMIDIVFLLLIFFVMTFKIVAAEGDFNIKMPLARPDSGTPDESLLPPSISNFWLMTRVDCFPMESVSMVESSRTSKGCTHISVALSATTRVPAASMMQKSKSMPIINCVTIT